MYVGPGKSVHKGEELIRRHHNVQNRAAPPSAAKAAGCALLALRGRCEAPLAMIM